MKSGPFNTALTLARGHLKDKKNKAKSISAELLELYLKNKLEEMKKKKIGKKREETGGNGNKRGQTGRNGKNGNKI